MASLNRATQTKSLGKGWVLPVITALGLFVVFMRLWYLQIVRGEELSRQAVNKRKISVPLPSPRGLIFDRRGAALAGLKTSLAVLVIPAEIEDNSSAIQRICAITGIQPTDLRAQIKENMYRKYLPFVARVGLTKDQAIAIEEQRAFMPGVSVRPTWIRDYPAAKSAVHVVGYVGAPGENDVNRLRSADIQLPNYVGKVGVERFYDLSLIGKPGTEWVYLDNRGRRTSEPETLPSIPGARLTLTIDSQLQSYASGLLAERRGAVVALDPSTGEVLCFVSSPSYDPNLFARRISAQEYKKIIDNPAQPMHNRAASSSWAPGSTFKMVTLTAAIQAGVVNPATTFVCSGSFKMGDRTFRCLGRHGRIDYARALERSCNVFFAELGTRLKREKMVAAARSYGFSRATGIDLIGESAGTLPDDERMKDKPWYPGDSVNLSVGQGYTSATPLQMANYVSVIANRGKSFKPHFLKMATEAAPDSPLKMTQPEIGCEVQLDDIWWDRIIKAMTRVIESGSGINARIRGLSFAGKTGSAEQRRGDKSHAWFVGFAPTENPRIAVAVVLETGGRGGSVAAPIAKALVERYLRGPATTQSSASSETTDSTASASSGLPSSR